MQNPDPNFHPAFVQQYGSKIYPGDISDFVFQVYEKHADFAQTPKITLRGAIDQTYVEACQPPVGPQKFCRTHDLRLNIGHYCGKPACADVDCTLCRHNPQKVCKEPMALKQELGKELLSPCQGHIFVWLTDVDGTVYSGPVRELFLQVYLIDSNKYDDLDKQRVDLPTIIGQCVVRLADGQPVLEGAQINIAGDPGLVVPFENIGTATMPTPVAVLRGLKVVAPSTKAIPTKNFRLLLCATSSQGARYTDLDYVASEVFTVAQKLEDRWSKKDYPSPEDMLAVVPGIGSETVRRLAELEGLARRNRQDLAGLSNVRKVGEFVQLLERCEQDEILRKKVEFLMNLNETRKLWDTGCAAAKLGVEVHKPDNRLRQYTARDGSAGLLYSCRQGQAQQPEAILLPLWPGANHWGILRKGGFSEQQAGVLAEEAKLRFQEFGHPGWKVVEFGNRYFDNVDELVQSGEGRLPM